MTTEEEKNWSLFAHVGTFLGHIIPFGHILVPLIVWLTKGEESRFVGQNARESLNFQISLTIYMLIAGALTLVLIGFVFMFAYGFLI